MGTSAKFATKQGTVTVTDSGITIPKTAGGALSGLGRWASVVGATTTIPRQDVHSVSVGGNNRQYATGARAAAVVATGGAALLAPSRIRGALVISTTGGDVYEFVLLRHDAKRPEAVAAAFGSRGYEVR